MRSGAAAGVAIGTSSFRWGIARTPSAAAPEGMVITVLHTNDTHSQIEPFPENDPRYANRGGAARRATLVKQVRHENPNTLLVDAGDAFQGSPFFNFYCGEVEYKVMSAIGYDAVTLGNHEFDNGVDALANATQFAKFDIVCANYDCRKSKIARRVRPYAVKKVGPYKVGIFGLGIRFQGLVLEKNHEGIVDYDPIAPATGAVRALRQIEGCHLVLCLSHLGYTPKEPDRVDDIHVAQQVSGIDLIVGGHTHTFMKEPALIKGPSGTITPIFQVGWAGINVGRVDFTIKAGKVIGMSGRILHASDAQTA